MVKEAKAKELTPIEATAEIFCIELKGRYGEQIKIVNETERNFYSGIVSASERHKRTVIIITELEGGREYLVQSRDQINDFAISLGAHVGYFTADGTISQNPRFNPINGNLAELDCISGYIFGEDPFRDEEELEWNF